MAIIQKIFAYNAGSFISGTTEYGDLIVGDINVDYSSDYGGVKWWGGPNEDLRYVIGNARPGGQPVPSGATGTAQVGFWGTPPGDKTDSAFLNLANYVGSLSSQPPFATTNDAVTWLNANGYYTSYDLPTPTPTPTPTCTPFINNIVISNGSYTATNGTYVRNSASDAFTQVGGTGTIFFGGDAWYLNAGVFGNVARNTSTLGTGTWNPWAPGNSSGIIADYSYYYCVTPTPTPTPTNTETPTGTPSETPTNTPTPTSTDLSSVTTFTISGCTNLNVLVADLGPSSLAPGDVFNFTFTGGTPNGCYRIVEKTVATPTDGATPLLFYVNCAACEATLVTPTPTTTSTPTPSVTNTQTPSVTPTLTPTPSTSPIPVTGYGFNLIVLPYNFPATGNTIMNETSPIQTGTTNPNELTISNRGIYFNSIDSDGIDRTSYYSQFTGQSVTITMTQTGSTAIYSGDTQAFKYWSGNTGTPPGVPGTGFVFGTNITVPGLTAGTGNAVMIQSASTNWVSGQTVYISVVNNNPSVTPTPTATSVTPTPTPTSGASGNFNILVSQVGPNVVWSGSGSFNLTSLTLNQNFPSVPAGFNQNFAQFIVGPTSNATTYSGSSFTTFPTSFGSGGGATPSSSSGSVFGVVQTGGLGSPREVLVPQGYVSGTVISGSTTYDTQTIAGMGLSGGTYTWAWGSGGNASSIVMTITP